MALRALTGLGWAGTYMTGLKLLADQVDAKMMSRAVTGHAASIGISGALSFLCGDLLAEHARLARRLLARGLQRGHRLAHRGAGRAGTAAAAAAGRPAAGAVRFPARAAQPLGHGLCAGLLRPHAGDERAARLGRGVPGLRRGAHRHGRGAFSPTLVVTALGLIGTTASVLGNEAAIRLGRRRLVCAAMVLSIALAAILGFVGSLSYAVAVVLLLVYGAVVWLNSSSLTAGAAGTAEPSRRGATLAVHSMLGYAGGFVGPLVIGWTLDLAGGMSRIGLGTGLPRRRRADGAGARDFCDDPAARARGRSGQLTVTSRIKLTGSCVRRPVLFMRSPPHLARSISVHRRDAEPDDQVRPAGERVSGHKPCDDDGDICHGVVSGRKERCCCQAAAMRAESHQQ